MSTFTPKHTWTLVSAHATDAESVGTFEQLGGTILPPAPSILKEAIEAHSVELGGEVE